jgi:hypothetical protein
MGHFTMSHWIHTVILILPISARDIAQKISRGFDFDTGGHDAFETLLSASGSLPATHVLYKTPAREEFYTKTNNLNNKGIPSDTRAGFMKADIDADYAARWTGITPPTKTEHKTFLDNVQVYSDVSLEEALQLAWLKIIISEGS